MPFKRFLSAVVFFVSANAASVPLKVVTYNAMLVCVGPACLLKNSPQREERNVAIGPWLRSKNADVYFIQEVWNKKQYEILLREGKFEHGYYFKDSDLAIFSRFPILEPKHFTYRWQASFETDCKRLAFSFPIGLGIAFIEPVQGNRIAIVNAHNLPRWPEVKGFADRADEHTPAREIHALEIIDALQSYVPSGTPVLFGGDLNANQVSQEYAFFVTHSGLRDAFRSIALSRGIDWTNACSFCADNPYNRAENFPGERLLDYVFFTHGDFAVRDARLLPDSAQFSDHLALEVLLDWETTSRNGVRPYLPSQTDLRRLQKYVDTVPISRWCWLSARGNWLQRSETTEFLSRLMDKTVAGVEPSTKVD
jgi:hypothetical protein